MATEARTDERYANQPRKALERLKQLDYPEVEKWPEGHKQYDPARKLEIKRLELPTGGTLVVVTGPGREENYVRLDNYIAVRNYLRANTDGEIDDALKELYESEKAEATEAALGSIAEVVFDLGSTEPLGALEATDKYLECVLAGLKDAIEQHGIEFISGRKLRLTAHLE